VESVNRFITSSSERSSCLDGPSEVCSALEVEQGSHLWLYECHHDQGTYLCFPPYCAPGGLRDRLFPSHPSVDSIGGDSGIVDLEVKREVPLISDFDCRRISESISGATCETKYIGNTEEIEVETDQEITFHDPFNIPFPVHHPKKSSKQRGTTYLTPNSTNNPLDLFLQTTQEHHLPLQYLIPNFVKQALQDRQHDWNTLGGSRCSLRRELLTFEREQFDVTNPDENYADKQLEAGIEESKKKSTLVSSSRHKPNEEDIKGLEPTEYSYFGDYTFGGLRSVTKQLVHQVASFSFPLIQVVAENIPHAKNISPLVSEIHLNSAKRTNRINSLLQVPKMAPAQQHTMPSASSLPNVPMNNTNTNNDEFANNAAGKPIPQAVLVYHESAHSIVFRDHLRRQQSAIRRTSSEMEHSAHVHSKHPSNHHHNHRAGLSRHAHPKNASHPHASRLPTVVQSAPTSVTNTPAASRNTTPAASRSTTPAKSRAASTNSSDTETNDAFQIETDIGYESAGSRGSTHSGRSDGGMSSASSVGSGLYKKNSNGVPLTATKQEKNRHHHHHNPPHASVHPVVVANFQPVIEPLEQLNLISSNVFEPLLDADPYVDDEESLEMSEAEKEVAELLKNEQAVVKTIRNADWTAFLQKFIPEEGKLASHIHHPAHCSSSRGTTSSETTNSLDTQYSYNSFVTSTSLLPSCGKKMRCFGSTNEYATGVVFAMPKAFPNDKSEDAAAKRTRTWSWPSGYSAKTEFNIDHHGNLINGREEALVPLSGMREMNYSYLHHTDYVVGGRMVKGGLQTIPYNEIYIRVGGLGRVVYGVDVVTGKKCDDSDGSGRSFDNGLGLPIALFIREADYSHIVGLLRTRARIGAIFGRETAKSMPLLLITPEQGVRVLTEKLQQKVFKTMAWDLNPFQNPTLGYRCEIDNTSETHLKQKIEELIDLDNDALKQVLTPEEMARIAGKQQ